MNNPYIYSQFRDFTSLTAEDQMVVEDLRTAAAACAEVEMSVRANFRGPGSTFGHLEQHDRQEQMAALKAARDQIDEALARAAVVDAAWGAYEAANAGFEVEGLDA